jgi:general stress protein 26
MAERKTINDSTQAGKILTEKLKDIPIASLTTRGDNGLVGRPMATQGVEFDGDLYFFTNARSQKIARIEADLSVSLSYAALERGLFLEISGTAQLSHDKADMKRFWQEELRVWFSKGLEDPDLVMLKIQPQRAEYWAGPGPEASDAESARETENVELIFAD